MRGTLAQATIFSVIVDVALTILTVATVPYLVNTLGVERYGVLGTISVLLTQTAFLQFGLGPALTRAIAEDRGAGRHDQVRDAQLAGHVLGLLTGTLMAGAVVLVGCLAFAHGFQASAGAVQEALGCLPAAAVLAAAQPALASAQSALTGQERFAWVNWLRLFQGSSRLAASVAAVAAGGGVSSVLAVQASVDWAAFIVVCLSAWPEGVRTVNSATIKQTKRLLGLGVPLGLAGIFAGLLMDTEKLVLGSVRSLADFAYYSVPFNALFRLSLVGGMLSVFLVPRIASLAAAGQGEVALHVTRQATRITAVTTGAAAVLAIALAPEILRFWLGPSFEELSTDAARILLVGVFANATVYPAHSAVRARAHPGILFSLYAVELPLYGILVYWLVTAWGIPGAATAWAIRALGDAVAQAFLAGRALQGRVVGAEVWALWGVLGGSAALFHILALSAVARAFTGTLAAALILGLVLSSEDRNLIRRALRRAS